jgi:hypothetical protein
VRVLCDNQSVVLIAARHKHEFITGKIKDFDVLYAIRQVSYRLQATFEHIKGHQDRETEQLITIELMN